ncbi:MAG TPA: aminotransferase class III-fold pyridoxal phosphate-dependent enzyme, partial [Acidimicrobiales bacterium]
DGAAAVEQALKIAFQYWWNQGITTRTRYLALGDAYHGDTVGALSIGAGGFGTDLFDPLRFPGVVRTPGYRTAGWLDAALSTLETNQGQLAAVVLEPLVQGAAGMYVAAPEDVGRLARACQAAGVLLVCDEVATGFGRTGTLFASEQCGVRPDLLCLGKGLTGGYLPMSATVACGRVADGFLGEDLGPRTLYHGHSFGGNALAAAVARRHLELLEAWQVLDNVVARAAQLEKRLAGLAALPAVREVRVCGLMAGVELDPPGPDRRWGRRVCAAAVDAGVLLRPLGEVVVLMPMLTSTAGEIDRIVDVLERAIHAGCR